MWHVFRQFVKQVVVSIKIFPRVQQRHSDRKQYFDEQSLTTRKYVIPYIETAFPLQAGMRVLEVGCGEGGNLPPFLDRGMEVYGIDISKNQIDNANVYLRECGYQQDFQLLAMDIYKVNPADLGGAFDVIFLRDVIEHIPNQEKFMQFIKPFLKPGGAFFFGFPPWYMPFGGHQQICEGKWSSKLPWYHLLPNPVYIGLLKIFGEKDSKVEELLEIKDTGISIERFQRISAKAGYETVNKTFYFINPNYETKFNLRPRVLPGVFGAIPFFRNFMTTAAYYLLTKK